VGSARAFSIGTTIIMAYFSSEGRKGEVNELRMLLRNPEVQRDAVKYRFVVQRVISYMTLGIDMSRLFTEMIMAVATHDLVRKKLVYLYICNYAESHSELSLLAVNTLQKDCNDQDPTIRGLALRSMCSLRLVNLVEYIQRPLVAGLDDRSSYVRKTAVIGCVKMHHLAPAVVRELGIVNKLYLMLQDKDPQVVCNCVVSLNEILASRGGMEMNRDIAHHLLARLKEFSEWSQCLVLQLLARYQPADEEEIFDILNILDDRLKQVNSGVVLATSRLFLSLTAELFELQEDINERIKTPLLTILGLGSSSPELVYTCLHHIQLLLRRQPRLFDADFKSFFCRYSDPSYLKLKKLELLVDIAAESNIREIIEELSAYATDVNKEMACKSIRAIGRIAVLHSSASDFCRMKLLALFSLEIAHVTTEVLIVMADLVRKYSDAATDIMSHLVSSVDVVTSSEGRAAIVWMLGQFGHELAEAPYLLERMINEISDEKCAQIRLQLLTATMKLFFKRPPECQEMLGRLLQHCIDEETDMDVHDRALLYYRLLKCGVSHVGLK
jgi:AP-4 complex subunit beta-1